MRALQNPLSVERHQGPSPGSMAKSVSSVAHRNLHRRENDADRLRGILGIHVARASRPLAFSEVDSGDGALCPSQAKELLSSAAVPAAVVAASRRHARAGRPRDGRRMPALRKTYAPLPAAAASPKKMLTSAPLPAPVTCAAAAR